jgi:hypothetical protein
VDPLIQVILTSSIRSNDISLVNIIHPSCARGRGGGLDQERGTGQVRPHLAGSTAPTRPAAPARPAVPGGSAVPSSCGTLVPFRDGNGAGSGWVENTYARPDMGSG